MHFSSVKNRALGSWILALGLAAASVACAAAPEDDSASTEAAATVSWSSSYPAIADARVPEKFDKVASLLVKLGPQTLPHEAKSLRKKIGELRDYVDVFAFAYTEVGEKDPWYELRHDLDTGYEEIGKFKDLFDAQGLELAEKDPATGQWGEGVRPEDVEYPDMQEVERRRTVALAWKAAFESRKAEHRAVVAVADAARLHAHRKLSRFFWGGADLEPSLQKSGLQNLGAMVRRLLELADQDYGAAAVLVDVTQLAEHEQFHDLRKRVRSVLKVLDYFPELLGSDAKASLELLDEFVERYGKLNDEISALGLVADAAEHASLEARIRGDWEQLRGWQESVHAREAMATLRAKVATGP